MSILFELLGYEPGRGGGSKNDFIPNIGVGLVGFASDVSEFDISDLHKLYVTSIDTLPDDNSTLVYLKNTLLSKVMPVLKDMTGFTPVTVYSDTTAYLDNIEYRAALIELKKELKAKTKQLKEMEVSAHQRDIGHLKRLIEYTEIDIFNKKRSICKREYKKFMAIGFDYKGKEIRLICNKYTYRFAVKQHGVWVLYRSIGNVTKILNGK
jgi:hypothetical protein